MPRGLDRALLARVEAFRKPDGGYEGDTRLAYGTAYGAFVALGAYQDLGHTPPAVLDLVRALKRLETPDGAWSNVPGAPVGALNATAGAVTLVRHLGFPVNAAVGDWVLHALAALERRIPSALHERCMDFLDTLWTAEGGFHGHWADDFVDAEYTYYGLLALGHLSL
jgi:hypothetical protein